MKELITLVLLFVVIHSNANDIDKLKTNQDVSLFLKANFKYRTFDLTDTAWVYNENQRLIKFADSLSVRYWFAEDLDNNKETDLFAYGYAETKKDKDGFLEMIVILSDKGKFRKVSLGEYYKRVFGSTEIFPTLLKIEQTPLIVIHTITKNFSIETKQTQSLLKTDTLTFKYGFPILYSNSTFNPKIKRIEFKTSQCFGTCPIFEMTITGDRKIVYDAIKYNKEQGLFSCKLTESEYDYIVSCLLSSNFTSLKDEYEVNWTDDQTATLKIEYDIDKVKQISDYGMVSNIGLMFFYRKLFDLRKVISNCR